MLKFKRLAQLSTDPDKIVASLAKSESKLMEISEDKKKIRRNPDKPVPEMNEERRKELMCRTVYIKGFPKDSQLSELLDFFAQKWKYENIVMRNYQDKKTKTWNFKGSVFLVFPTVEEAKAFLEEKEFTYKDGEMIRMWQSDYIDQKRKEYDERKKSQKKKPDENSSNITGIQRVDCPVQDAGGEGKDEEAEKEDDGLPRGTIVKVTGLKGDIGREDLKEKIEGMGLAVAFVDFSMGKDEGWIRLEEKDAAKEVCTTL
ncbi:hypothetical protein AAG570_001973 [Ranatra chinensis]|uniref:Uncharacterized protein n=1 Tax=Ranatra chinensis TaxID=642074 RepID=A0ABD0YA44_9HEMI